jgi:hypothetical protein
MPKLKAGFPGCGLSMNYCRLWNTGSPGLNIKPGDDISVFIKRL